MTNSLPIPTDWNNQLAAHNGHLLQSRPWGELKSSFGWTAHRIQTGDAAAQILFKRLPLGFTIAYIPKGPVTDGNNPLQCRKLLDAIHAEAKQRHTVFLKIEPDVEQRGRNEISVQAPNVYHGFAFRDESTTFDTLALSVDGPLLEELYLDIRRGLEIEAAGGPRVKVLRVSLVDCAIEGPASGGPWRATVTWIFRTPAGSTRPTSSFRETATERSVRRSSRS